MRVALIPSLAFFAIGFFLSTLIGYLHLPYSMRGGATAFASGFAEFAFQTIHAGETEQEVESALGKPLAMEHWNAIDTWIYQPSDWIASPHRSGEIVPATRRTITEFTDFQFDQTGNVVCVFGDFLKPNPPTTKTREAVKAEYGMPTMRLARPELKACDYAQPDGKPIWKVRRVLYDMDGKVFASTGFTHFSPTRVLPSINPFTPVQ